MTHHPLGELTTSTWSLPSPAFSLSGIPTAWIRQLSVAPSSIFSENAPNALAIRFPAAPRCLMPIEFQCQTFQTPYAVKNELAGKRTKCLKCQSLLHVPAPAADLSETPAEEARASSFKNVLSRADRPQSRAHGNGRNHLGNRPGVGSIARNSLPTIHHPGITSGGI
jgi:hypothetical protein